MSSSAPIVDRIRIIPRPDDFLDRNVGSSGEVFFNRATSSLRVFNGRDRSGFELARADLANVDTSTLNITNDDINWIAYETLDDLPSATDNHGMFAHVHSEGRGYFAHAGAWVALANVSDLAGAGGGASVDIGNSAPVDPSIGNLWLNTLNGKLYIYIDDGDSEQWIQPAMPTFSGDFNDLTNIPTYSLDDLSDVDLTTEPETGEVLKWNGSSWAPGTDIAETGAGLDANTLNGEQGGYYLDYTNFTNTPTSFTNLTLNGTTTLQKSTEILSTLSNAEGVVVHNYTNGSIFYHSSINDNFTANFTNIPTTNNRTISLTLILTQGGDPFIPTSVQINSVATNINWLNASTPTGNPDQIDIVSFTLLRVGTSWTVLGSLTTHG